MVLSLVHKLRVADFRKYSAIFLDSIKRGLAPYFLKNVVIYRRIGPPPQPRLPDGLIIERHDNENSLVEALEGAWDNPVCAGLENVDYYIAEIKRSGVAWIGKMNGVVAAIRWSKPGKFVKGWYLELQPDELAFYGAVTLYGFRGKGIHGAMFRHVLANEPHTAAYVDFAQWNKVAQRSAERAGFTKITTMRRKSALGTETLKVHEKGKNVTVRFGERVAKGTAGWHAKRLVKFGYWQVTYTEEGVMTFSPIRSSSVGSKHQKLS